MPGWADMEDVEGCLFRFAAVWANRCLGFVGSMEPLRCWDGLAEGVAEKAE